MKILKKTRLATAMMLCGPMLLAAGCGGSSSGSDDGDAVVSRGEITGFGSVYVNGRRYQTDSSSFRVDDDDGVEGDLRLGMIVTVHGSRKDDGYHADRIYYDNELKGPVGPIIDIIDGDSKTLTILGQSVLVTRDTKIDDDGNLAYDTIAPGDVLEVSGYISDSQLIATHIELQDGDDEIEIKGVIEKLGEAGFEIRGFPVSYDDSTEIDDDIRELANGLYVEVEGELDSAGTTLIAREIEAEDDGFDDDENEVEIKGVISGYNGETSRFTLQGMTVDASTAQLDPASLVLGDDLLVEVEGYIADGVLFADEVELEDDDDDDSNDDD
jgi:hypothetical protein